MGKLPDATTDRIKRELGIDIQGFSAIINGNDVRHIIKEHGDSSKEMARGQVGVKPEDIALIPQLLSSPDKIFLSPNFDGKGRLVLVFEKEIGDKYITMQAISDGTHAIQTDTLYIKKKSAQDTGHNAAVGDPVSNVQNVPPQGSS